MVTALEKPKRDSQLGDLFGSLCGGEQAELYDLRPCDRAGRRASDHPLRHAVPKGARPLLRVHRAARRRVQHGDDGLHTAPPGHHAAPRDHRRPAGRPARGGPRQGAVALRPFAGGRRSLLRHAHAARRDDQLPRRRGRQAAPATGADVPQRRRCRPGHAPNLRPAYRNRGITLGEMRTELASEAPFAGVASDGRPYGDGIAASHEAMRQACECSSCPLATARDMRSGRCARDARRARAEGRAAAGRGPRAGATDRDEREHEQI